MFDLSLYGPDNNLQHCLFPSNVINDTIPPLSHFTPQGGGSEQFSIIYCIFSASPPWSLLRGFFKFEMPIWSPSLGDHMLKVVRGMMLKGEFMWIIGVLLKMIRENAFEQGQWKSKAPLFRLVSIPYFETSAVTGVDVERAVTALLGLVMKRMEQSTYGGHNPEPNGSPGTSHEVQEAPVRRRCACWWHHPPEFHSYWNMIQTREL